MLIAFIALADAEEYTIGGLDDANEYYRYLPGFLHILEQDGDLNEEEKAKNSTDSSFG